MLKPDPWLTRQLLTRPRVFWCSGYLPGPKVHPSTDLTHVIFSLYLLHTTCKCILKKEIDGPPVFTISFWTAAGCWCLLWRHWSSFPELCAVDLSFLQAGELFSFPPRATGAAHDDEIFYTMLEHHDDATWSFNLPPWGEPTVRVWRFQHGSCVLGELFWWHQHPLSAAQSLCCSTSSACAPVCGGDLAH